MIQRPIRKQWTMAALAFCLMAGAATAQNKRDTTVLEDKARLAKDESWFYDNFESAVAEAKRTDRPIMVVFR